MAKRLEPVDVVVIGSGMGGAAFCQRLSYQRPDLKIVCLERGGWVRPEYGDCAAIARREGVPLRDVMQEAEHVWRAR